MEALAASNVVPSSATHVGNALTLADIVYPTKPQQFLRDVMGRSLLHAGGVADRFVPLLPWSRLNEILALNALDYPRMKLIKGTMPRPRDAYLGDYYVGQKKRPRTLSTKMIQELREGATLIINAVQDFSTPLQQLCFNLEQVLRTNVNVNTYVAFRDLQGFDLHFDDHDVFILQVYGHKDWCVYGETLPNTVKDIAEPPRPDGAPVFKRRLAPGDMLYIPRGWWHYATPCEEPSLHLTVGTMIPTFLDLIGWLQSQLFAANGDVRSRLPIYTTNGPCEEQVDRIAESLSRHVIESLRSVDTVERYIRYLDSRRHTVGALGLPWTATGAILPPSEDCIVRSTCPRPLWVRTLDSLNESEVVVDGQTYYCDSSKAQFLGFVAEYGPMSVSEFYSRFESYSREELKAVLVDLVLAGLVAVDET